MPEQQVEIRCPGCGARYWVEPAQVGTEVECGECHQKFAGKAELADTAPMVRVKVAFYGEAKHANQTISGFMREHGVKGGVSLEESGGSTDARDILQTDSGHKYAVGTVVAKGGMGAILNCRDLNVRRNVAMKVMLNPEKVEQPQILRFIEEAQVTGQLEHPGVVPVYELGVDTGSNVFYTMKFVRGHTLTDILKDLSSRDAATVAAFPLNRLLNVFLRVCEAMAYAHYKHVIHRDLKPENIMIGDFGEVYVMDWGLAKVMRPLTGAPEAPPPDLRGRTVGPPDLPLTGAKRGPQVSEDPSSAETITGPRFAPRCEGAGESKTPRQGTGQSPDALSAIDHARKGFGGAGSNTLDGAVMGTPHFMAPEQAQGKITALDARADVYALGGILYEILSLQRAVGGPTLMAILMRVAHGELTPLPTTADPAARPHCPGGQIPAALAAVAMKALSFKPEDRYQTVKELQVDLEAYQAGFATSAERAGLWRQLVLLVQRHKTFAISALAVVLALAVGLTVALVQWRKTTAAETVAVQARGAAEQARGQAVKARSEAEQARDVADSARRQTEVANRELEQQNYINLMAAVQAKLDLGITNQAHDLLWRTPVQLRGWEWGCQIQRCHPELLSLPAPVGGQVASVAVSKDGRQILVGTHGAIIVVYDSANGNEVRRITIPDGRRFSFAAFVGGDGAVVTGAQDGVVELWEPGTDKPRWSGKGHQGQVYGVAATSDGKRLVSWGLFDKTVRVWDAATGKPSWSGEGYNQGLTAVAFSPDGQRVVVACRDRTFMTYDATSGMELQRTTLPFGVVAAVAFSPDGTRIAGAAINRGVIWQTADPKQNIYLYGHSSGVIDVAFAPDGKSVLTTSSDGSARLWEAATGREVRRFLGHSGMVSAVAFFPDGLRFITTGVNDRNAKIWATTGTPAYRTLNVQSSNIFRVAFSPDGTQLLASCWEGNQAKLMSVASGECLREFKGHTGPVTAVAFSPDGQRVLTGSRDKTAKLWDVASGRELLTLPPQVDSIIGVAFAPNGRTVLTQTQIDGRIGPATVWDAASGTALWSQNGTNAAAYSPDGRYVLAGSWLKDVATGKTIRALPNDANGISAFSPDSRYVLVARYPGDPVRLFDVETGNLVREFVGHTQSVVTVGFSPDGRRAVTGSWDETARVWDVATGRELAVVRGAGSRVYSAVFSPDGRLLALGQTGVFDVSVLESLPPTTTPEQVQEWKRARYGEWLKRNEAGK